MDSGTHELYMQRGPTPGLTVVLGSESLTIGRDPYSDIVINDPEVSRQHALLIARPKGGYLLQDLGSTNGTFVDGGRLGSDAVALRPSSKISIGGAVTLVVRERPGAAPDVVDTPAGEFEVDERAAGPRHVESAPPAVPASERPVKSDPPKPSSLPASRPVRHSQQGVSSAEPSEPSIVRAPANPEQNQPESTTGPSPNLVLGLVLLLLCCLVSFFFFLIYLGGDWYLRQLGLVP